MKRFVVTLVVAAVLALGSLFPIARSAYAAPRGPWVTQGYTCFTNSGDVGYSYYNSQSGHYRCFRP